VGKFATKKTVRRSAFFINSALKLQCHIAKNTGIKVSSYNKINIIKRKEYILCNRQVRCVCHLYRGRNESYHCLLKLIRMDVHAENVIQ